MSDARFDLSYIGLIAPGADPELARQRLSDIFRLSEKGAERLFAGRPVVVKRGVDAATAARFEKIFAHAGAILTVTPVERVEYSDREDLAAMDTVEPTQVQDIDTTHLALAPLPGGPLEEPLVGVGPDLDLSYLALVPGDDWTLEDCEAPATPIPEPDISYLSLVPIEPQLEPEPDHGLA